MRYSELTHVRIFRIGVHLDWNDTELALAVDFFLTSCVFACTYPNGYNLQLVT